MTKELDDVDVELKSGAQEQALPVLSPSVVQSIREWFRMDEPFDPCKLPEATRSGRCYEMAFRRMIVLNDDSWCYIQGYPRLRSKDEFNGRLYGHAWLEHTQLIDVPGLPEPIPVVTMWDPTTDMALPRDLYYMLGRVDQKYTKRWTLREMMVESAKQGFIGPWHQPDDLPEEPAFVQSEWAPKTMDTPAIGMPRGSTPTSGAGRDPGHTPRSKNGDTPRQRNSRRGSR